MHISNTKFFNIPVSIALATLAHIINVYDILPQYNKLSDIQYARFQILPVYLHFGLFWSADIPTMSNSTHMNIGQAKHDKVPSLLCIFHDVPDEDPFVVPILLMHLWLLVYTSF